MKELNKEEFLKLHMLDDKKYAEIISEYNVESKQLTNWYDNGGETQELIRKANKIFNSKKDKVEFKTFKKMGKREFFEWYKKEHEKGCLYCGITEDKLEKLFDKEDGNLKTKRGRGRVLELERKDATKNTYEPDNCGLACYLCNNHKSDLISKDDFKKYFAKNIRSYLEDKYKELE